jgi:hypothetical protein
MNKNDHLAVDMLEIVLKLYTEVVDHFAGRSLSTYFPLPRPSRTVREEHVARRWAYHVARRAWREVSENAGQIRYSKVRAMNMHSAPLHVGETDAY